MKIFLSFFIFVFLLYSTALMRTAVFAEETILMYQEPVKMYIDGFSEAETADITDGDYSTMFKSDRFALRLVPEQSAKALYIIWNEPPQEYAVTVGGETFDCGDGFMHKLITFPESVECITVDSPNGGEICDIYLFEDTDKLPDYVQNWEPPCVQADMLVFSAHADDEFLMFGGTVPYYANELDLRVQIVYMTTHWEEQPRPHELLDGLWAAGVENYPVFGIIPDIPYQPIFTLSEAAALYDFDEVLEWFTAQIRRFKPSVIITHDLKGEYGHAAHKLAAKTAVDAVEISFDPDKFPESAEKYGVWDVPKTYLHFYEENALQMDWEIPLESFGGITAREAAALCYDKHKSQHIWGYSVNYGEDWDCRQFGLYRSLVGSDTKADFMDNITPVAVTQPALDPETEIETETQTESSETTPEIIPETSKAVSEETPAETQKNNSEINENGVMKLLIVFAALLLVAVIIVLTQSRKNKKNGKKRNGRKKLQ